MTAGRRFTDVHALDPESVRSLPPFHDAMVENRTLFPSTVVTVTKDAPCRDREGRWHDTAALSRAGDDLTMRPAAPLADKIEALIAEGLGTRAIAEKLRCDPTYVSRIRRRRTGLVDTRHRGPRTDKAKGSEGIAIMATPFGVPLDEAATFDERCRASTADFLAALDIHHPERRISDAQAGGEV